MFLRLITGIEKERLETLTSIITTIGIYCQQSIQYNMKINSTRCLLIFLFVSSVLIQSFYTSTVVSSTINSQRDSSLRTKEDLANSDIPIAFQGAAATKAFLMVIELCSPVFT